MSIFRKHKEKHIEVYRSKIQSTKEETPFGGTSLSELCDQSDLKLPFFLEHCFSFLTEKALAWEGIFRLSGDQNKMTKLKAQWEAGTIEGFAANEDPNTVAGLLKTFFRELPEPILTFELYDCFIASQGIMEEYRVDAVKKILTMLPTVNTFILYHLMEFLKKVADNSDKNKMTATNLAICFAPNLLRCQVETVEIVIGDAMRCKNVVAVLISKFDVIFADIKEKLDKLAQEQAKHKEEKQLEFKKQMEMKYVALKKDAQNQLRKDKTKSMQIGALSQLEDQWAREYAQYKVGIFDEDLKNEQAWTTQEYKKVYQGTLKRLKNTEMENPLGFAVPVEVATTSISGGSMISNPRASKMDFKTRSQTTPVPVEPAMKSPDKDLAKSDSSLSKSSSESSIPSLDSNLSQSADSVATQQSMDKPIVKEESHWKQASKPKPATIGAFIGRKNTTNYRNSTVD